MTCIEEHAERNDADGHGIGHRPVEIEPTPAVQDAADSVQEGIEAEQHQGAAVKGQHHALDVPVAELKARVVGDATYQPRDEQREDRHRGINGAEHAVEDDRQRTHSRPNTTPTAATAIVTAMESFSSPCSAAAWGMPQCRLDRKDEAGGRAVGQELARSIHEPAFRGGDARADVDDPALSPHRAGLVGHGADVVDLDLDRGVADTRLQHGVDAAAHHRIEQGGGDAAMHAAQRIVVIEARRVAEDDAARLGFDHREAQRLRRSAAPESGRPSCP